MADNTEKPGKGKPTRTQAGAMPASAALPEGSDQQDLLDWARTWAPTMQQQHPQLAQRHLERWLGSKAEFLKA